MPGPSIGKVARSMPVPARDTEVLTLFGAGGVFAYSSGFPRRLARSGPARRGSRMRARSQGIDMTRIDTDGSGHGAAAARPDGRPHRATRPAFGFTSGVI